MSALFKTGIRQDYSHTKTVQYWNHLPAEPVVSSLQRLQWSSLHKTKADVGNGSAGLESLLETVPSNTS